MPWTLLDSVRAAREQQRLEEHFRSHAEANVFHLWGEDRPPAFEPPPDVEPAPQTTSDRALLIANSAAEVLERVHPSGQLSFLAYHETEKVPAKVRPRSNVCLLWAPRERCYAHAADDDECPLNRRYRDTFLAQLSHFGSAGGAPARVFEYYLDSILFPPAPPPLVNVIHRDLAFYREAGAQTVQALMTGHDTWREPHPNAWLFARLAWGPKREPSRLLNEFCEALSGPDTARVKRYRVLEQEAAGSLARGH